MKFSITKYLEYTKSYIKYLSDQYLLFIQTTDFLTAIKALFICIFIKNETKRIVLIKNLKYNFLKNRYAHIIEKYKDKKQQDSIYNDGPIWFCWWQGEDRMPEIVQICYKQAKKMAPENHPIVFISKFNYHEYCDIPEIIIDKLNKGLITLTHFSDILRMQLLYKNGGLWLDSTIYVSSPIKEELFKQPLISIKAESFNHIIGSGNWCSFFVGGPQKHYFFEYMNSYFNEYWDNQTMLIDYFLIAYVFELIYNNNINLKREIDNSTISTNYILCKNLNSQYTEQSFNEIIQSTQFHKLSFKIGITENTAEKNIYNYLKNSIK